MSVPEEATDIDVVRLGPLPSPAPWMSHVESHKAWMSVRDADLLERLLVLQAARLGGLMRVLEWGAGRSSLWFSDVLRRHRVRCHWLSIEHHREFFLEDVAPELAKRPDAGHVLAEDLGDPSALAFEGGPGLCAIVFDAGELRPFERGTEHDRIANLDDYVALPGQTGLRFDLVVVDGRKRRRCLLEASRLLTPAGLVVLHDAWRRHYQCAFSAYRFGQRIGDELWVGAQHAPGLDALLPAHALGGHLEHG